MCKNQQNTKQKHLITIAKDEEASTEMGLNFYIFHGQRGDRYTLNAIKQI